MNKQVKWGNEHKMVNTIQTMNIIRLNSIITYKYKRDSEDSLRNINL